MTCLLTSKNATVTKAEEARLLLELDWKGGKCRAGERNCFVYRVTSLHSLKIARYCKRVTDSSVSQA